MWSPVFASLSAAKSTLPAAPVLAAGQPAYHPGQRPTALPLLAGATGGAVIGGSGDHLLLGFVTLPDGTHLPAEWTGGPANWAVTDLSAGGQLTGRANSIDRHGDILINDGENIRAWVVTADGTAHELHGFGGPSSGVGGSRMNDRGEIAGVVFGPAPGYVAYGAVWANYAATPRDLDPLPFPGSADSTALGMNDEGVLVGNSDNANFSDLAGGAWLPGSSRGFLLPGCPGRITRSRSELTTATSRSARRATPTGPSTAQPPGSEAGCTSWAPRSRPTTPHFFSVWPTAAARSASPTCPLTHQTAPFTGPGCPVTPCASSPR